MASFDAGHSPLGTPLLNRQEVINEISIMLAIYPLFSFTDLVTDQKMKDTQGFIIVSIICFSVLLNMSIVTYKVLLFLILKVKSLKKRCLTCKQKKASKQQQKTSDASA